MYVYRWDLDKTYLQTDFDSLRGLVRSATEPASAKRAVPGARAVMRGLSANPQARIYIVSGSPTQMRPVLEEKLRLDGVRWDHLTLKDNLGNLKRGRLRAIRGQFGYKLPELLRTRVGLGRAVRETCFGDDAEIDAVVYSVYADAVAGRLDASQVSRIMEASGAYPDQVQEALDALARLSTAQVVDRIFIRLERRVPSLRFEPLGGRVVPIHSWWQAALVLLHEGHLRPGDVAAVLDAVRTEAHRDPFAVAGLTQDIVRRGHVPPEVLDTVPFDDAWLAACRSALRALGPGEHRPPPADVAVDYLDLVRTFGRDE
ncbi:hypothetical protein L6R53_15545 [Myxococcota bacterium]|nr:hypothetical protein [Myxococcota bacterium]